MFRNVKFFKDVFNRTEGCSCLSCFSHYCGQMPDKKPLKGEGVLFVSQSKGIQSIQVDKAWWQECKMVLTL